MDQLNTLPRTKGIIENTNWNLKKILWRKLRKFQLLLSPQQNLLFGFLVYSIIGWMLLCLPFMHKLDVSPIDHLFTAASALSTTGLVTSSLYDTYNIWGQMVVALLIQIGGIGYMTFTSFVLIAKGSQLTHWHQRVLNAEFSVPREFKLRDFLKALIIFTIIIELLGAICFYIGFIRLGVEPNFALWSSIFHSISTFCTAGFGLYNDSFEQFKGDVFLNTIISVLALAGSLGFIVVTDVWHRITGRSKKLTFTTHAIIHVTWILLLVGTALFYFFEPTLALYEEDKLMISFFQAMTALTTVGFNTIPVGNLTTSVLMVLVMLMFIGASPAGTGGGLKSTTFAILITLVWNKIRNNRSILFFGKKLSSKKIELATSIFTLYSGVMCVAVFLLLLVDDFPLEKIIFEAVSALGTVGLSTGITGQLSVAGKLILIAVMFVGRLGVLTFGLALLAHKDKNMDINAEEDLSI